eukprot:CAMPEP_0119034392 /NCGR_PEP_ID=MMETSP1177-20130426/1385_1 /TAXON_ID=2985 /ORGANISM="Ochromonas sp, Strain CCMP1899" /LENGTH=39 /DNA_ID= /DNA_START= /DNA_END= /DNA_ORIENTATION=
MLPTPTRQTPKAAILGITAIVLIAVLGFAGVSGGLLLLM